MASSLHISSPGTPPARASQRHPEQRIYGTWLCGTCLAVSCSTIFIAHLQVEANTERARAEQSQRTTPCLTEGWGEAQHLFCCLGFIRPVLPSTKPYTNVAETSFSSEQETMLLIPVLPSGGLHPFQPVLCSVCPSPQLQGLSHHFNPPCLLYSFLHFHYQKYFLLPAYSPPANHSPSFPPPQRPPPTPRNSCYTCPTPESSNNKPDSFSWSPTAVLIP